MDRSEIKKLAPEQKEAFHRQAEARMQPIRYAPPQSEKPKDVLMPSNVNIFR